MRRIYLDHAASTPLYPEVSKAMIQFLHSSPSLANPSSTHYEGQKARALIDQARLQVETFFSLAGDQVIFTSGATESLQLAIIGSFLTLKQQSLPQQILFSPLAHTSVYQAVNFLRQHFSAQITPLPIDKHGFLALDKLADQNWSQIGMVIAEHGNSELGLIQPVAKLGKMIRSQRKLIHSPVFVVDASASVVTEPIGLEWQKADLIACSGEKFGGLSGAGLLLDSRYLPITPLMAGSQEWGHRGGTENLLGIVALAKTLHVHQQKRNSQRQQFCQYHQQVRDFFIKYHPDWHLLTPEDKFLPHIFAALAPANIDITALLARCDLSGLALASGPACSSGSLDGSRVLSALGYDDRSTQGLRLSWGWNTTITDITQGLARLSKIIATQHS